MRPSRARVWCTARNATCRAVQRLFSAIVVTLTWVCVPPPACHARAAPAPAGHESVRAHLHTSSAPHRAAHCCQTPLHTSARLPGSVFPSRSGGHRATPLCTLPRQGRCTDRCCTSRRAVAGGVAVAAAVRVSAQRLTLMKPLTLKPKGTVKKPSHAQG